MSLSQVTHDRFFLERVCSEILELDRGSIYKYTGNYGRYLELKVSLDRTGLDYTGLD